MAAEKKSLSNEETFLKAITTSQKFRNALKKKNRESLSKELDRIGVKADNKDAILDAILQVDWAHLKALEERLHTGPSPLMN